MTIRVIIADDHPIVRSGIRNELMRYADFEVVGEAVNGDETVHLADQLKPDVILLDIQMPGKRSIEVVYELQNQGKVCILVLSAHDDVPTIIGMLKAGVSGYVLKDEDPIMITEAIQAVIRGDTFLSPRVLNRMDAIIERTGGIKNNSELTKREFEVLQSLATGSTNREIAYNLHTTERTVEFHITNIFRKLEVKGRLEAAMKAKQLGIL